MKKSKLFLSAAVIPALLLTGCNLDDPENIDSMDFNVMNHISPLDSSDEAVIEEGQYSFTLDMNKGNLFFRNTGFKTVQMGTSFACKTTPFKLSTITDETLMGSLYSFSMAGDAQSSNSGLSLSNLSGKISSLSISGGGVIVPGYPMVSNTTNQLVMKYTLSDKYVVRTFNGDALYGGQTVTTDDSGVGFTSDKMIYRVKIDPANKKAALIIYECKFSESMPMTLKAIVLENLTLNVTSTGYVITGNNLTPMLPEGEELSPFPGFMFEDVNVTTVDSDLTTIKVDYSVRNVRAGSKYTGEFEGSYVVI